MQNKYLVGRSKVKVAKDPSQEIDIEPEFHQKIKSHAKFFKVESKIINYCRTRQ